jgi:hypothetical protein
MRARLLNIKILGGKSDIKSVYRRVSLSGDTVVKCAMVCNNLALISLFLTFGGSPCPNEWCIVSEICTDLANDIIHCKDWNPVHLYSPHAQKLPPPLYLSDSIPFTQVAELDVDVPTYPFAPQQGVSGGDANAGQHYIPAAQQRSPSE